MPAIYQADVWCDSCAADIRDRIIGEGFAPAHPDDETTYDSDEYPKSMSDDESADSPQHCASGADCLEGVELSDGTKVGCLFGDLTPEGLDYVREAIREGGIVSEYWRQYYSERGHDLTTSYTVVEVITYEVDAVDDGIGDDHELDTRSDGEFDDDRDAETPESPDIK